MAVVHPDFYRHENFVRKSIQIPSAQHKELKALAVELESSLGDVVETIMELMQQDNYRQLKTAILQKREQALSSLIHTLVDADNYLVPFPQTFQDYRFCFEVCQDCVIV